MLNAPEKPPNTADVVEECWLKAVDHFNSRLTKDRQKKLKVEELGKKFDCCTLGQLARSIEANRRPVNDLDRGWKSTLRTIIRKLNDCAPAGDVVVATQPVVAALVWGAIRLCLQLGASYVQFLDDIGHALVVIAGSTGIYEQVARTFKENRDILDQIAEYFAHILGYLVRLEIQISRRGIAGVLRGSISLKLNRCFSDLKALELRLDQRITHTIHQGHIVHETRVTDEIIAQKKFREGSGKTVLVHTLASALENQTILLFSFGTEIRRSRDQIRQLFLSMLLRICTSGLIDPYHDIAPGLIQLKRLRTAFGHASQCGTQQLAQTTRDIVSILPPVILIIDAVDQCGETDDRNLLMKTLTAISENADHAVVLTSRGEPTIPNSHMIELTPDKTKLDIERYAIQEISRFRGLQSIQHEILRRIDRDSAGSFLWVHLLLDHVRQGPSLQTRTQKLKAFPTEPQRVYEAVIRESACKFEEQDQERQKCILRVLATTRSPLTLQSLFLMVDGDDSNAEFKGSSRNDEDLGVDLDALCHPLVRVRAAHVYLTHPTLREYIYSNARSEDPDLFLARKCLEKLTNERYRSWKTALRLLRKHLLPPHMVSDSDDSQPLKESVLYEYAVLHWHEHVSALRKPPVDVLGLLSQFLEGIESVVWSENLFEAKQQSGIAPQLEVQTMLKTWYDSLDKDTQEKIPIKDYFVKPHEELQKELKEKAQDKVAPYLPFMRLGQFFNLGGRSQRDWHKGFMYKEAVAAGFESSLGARHPLTLQTKTSMLQEFFWQRRFEEAEHELSKVAAIQREIYDQDSLDVYVTVQLLGYAQFSCARFKEAMASLEETEKAFQRLEGENSPKGLVTRLYQGYVQERQRELITARRNYEIILREWTPIGGDAHPLSIMARTALGMVCRKLKEHSTAEESLLNAWRQRRKIFGDDLNLTVDTALSLALEYRDNTKLDLAKQVLEAIKSSEVFTTDFERGCQWQYVLSLIDFDRGYYNRPRMVLRDLIDQSIGDSREDNNRSLLWIRLTLANVLRHHENPDEAAALFSEIVEPTDEVERRFWFAPEPPERLRIAEQALQLVQECREDEAKALLHANRLQWVRERDFDILQGGPVTDVAVTNPVVTIVTDP
ncbi:hypothetical protein AYO20_10519 [Fonsecaea nubica]|uniref:Nephrocystin 3-like N-terminal domain-containing protein n=1 Tax=Fonsecaea nubica TaxID=856822 RepID=A0A178C7D8_9EURO|nr:hypothetical protein AYO20_10519 [Fonsecaea nubica]OAL24985.1 hypothetical protein AYO20_10519 [Fonsecaea nubica]